MRGGCLWLDASRHHKGLLEAATDSIVGRLRHHIGLSLLALSIIIIPFEGRTVVVYECRLFAGFHRIDSRLDLLHLKCSLFRQDVTSDGLRSVLTSVLAPSSDSCLTVACASYCARLLRIKAGVLCRAGHEHIARDLVRQFRLCAGLRMDLLRHLHAGVERAVLTAGELPPWLGGAGAAFRCPVPFRVS